MFSGVWYFLRFSPRAKASISLLIILSIVGGGGGGGGGVGQKFSPFSGAPNEDIVQNHLT